MLPNTIHDAERRPLLVTVAGWLFIAAGTIGLWYHASEYIADGQSGPGEAWVLLVRCFAIVAGVFILRRADWARWLAVAWIAYHVILSAFHSVSETVVHIVVFAAVAYALLRADASAWFRHRTITG